MNLLRFRRNEDSGYELLPVEMPTFSNFKRPSVTRPCTALFAMLVVTSLALNLFFIFTPPNLPLTPPEVEPQNSKDIRPTPLDRYQALYVASRTFTVLYVQHRIANVFVGISFLSSMSDGPNRS